MQERIKKAGRAVAGFRPSRAAVVATVTTLGTLGGLAAAKRIANSGARDR